MDGTMQLHSSVAMSACGKVFFFQFQDEYFQWQSPYFTLCAQTYFITFVHIEYNETNKNSEWYKASLVSYNPTRWRVRLSFLWNLVRSLALKGVPIRKKIKIRFLFLWQMGAVEKSQFKKSWKDVLVAEEIIWAQNGINTLSRVMFKHHKKVQLPCIAEWQCIQMPQSHSKPSFTSNVFVLFQVRQDISNLGTI